MFARTFGDESYADDYRGFRRVRPLAEESDQQRARRLGRSRTTIQFVEWMQGQIRHDLQLRAGSTKQGIIPALHRRFYPLTGLETIAGNAMVGSTSSATIGSGVDEHMHTFATTLKLPARCHRYARWIAEFCRLHNFFPLAAQLAIRVGTRCTAADLVCLNNHTGRLVVLEIKTGYDRFYTQPCSSQPELAFFAGVPNTWQNHHLLQLSTMVHALTRPPYGVPVSAVEGYVLRVNQTHGVCAPLPVPRWFDAPLVFELLALPVSKVRSRLRRLEKERRKRESEKQEE